MDRFKTVIVSNRLPISVKRVDGALVYERSSGGLATAMSTLEGSSQIWVGWPGIDADDLSDAERAEVSAELAVQGCYPVFLSHQQIDEYYEGYANDTLWPLFHYFQSVANYADKNWHAYQEVNRQFAAAVAEVAEPYANIWVQDYHFMLLPAMVREHLPEARIGFFLHIPFPSFEIFRLLPERKELLAGLLGADVIGFHTYDYGRHFISSCMRLLGATINGNIVSYDSRSSKVGSYPIGIDYESFSTQRRTRETKDALRQLDEAYKNQKLILSMDRLDYSKGIPERLEAYRLLLEEHPEYHGKIKLLMIAVPSRIGVEAYQDLRDEIEKTVSRINGTYGTVDWAPISYQFQNRPFAEIVALYARADIALITPIRDGMNLVAKEYVASKSGRPGVLVLSEMAGAIDDLPEALSINPNDARSIMQAIDTALAMSKTEQKKRLASMQRRLRSATVQQWGRNFIEDLEASNVKDSAVQFKKLLSSADQKELIESYRKATKRLLILDYDGTLKRHTNTPSAIASTPSLRVRRIIKQLSDQPGTTVAIVSGRPRKALSRWFVGLKIELIAEHGAWTKHGKSWRHVKTDFNTARQRFHDIMADYTARTKGAEIEEKDYALVWHYANVEPDTAYKRASELHHDLAEAIGSTDASVHKGHNIVEIKPSSVSKSGVVRDLLKRFPADFVLCAGDDYTDEDMFMVLDGDPIASTIKIGTGATRARHQLKSPSALLQLLDNLTPQRVRVPLPDVKRRLNKPLSWLRRK